MDLRQIEHVIKIAEEKSITRASEKLFLTQSALNQQLLKLEHELGTDLFKRSKTSLEPTKAGEFYLDGAKEILRIKQRTYSRITDLTDSNKGHIIIGLTPGRGPDMFINVYPIFHKNYPNMIVEPRELSVSKQQPLISSGDLDIGFMTIFPYQKTDDNYITLYSEEVFLAVPKTFEVNKCAVHKDNNSLIINFADLENIPFILMRKESTLRKVLNQIFRDNKFTPNVLFETANNSTIMEMVKAQICCGIVPAYAMRNYKEGINYYSFPTPLTWEVVVSYQRGSLLSKASQIFIQHAKTYWTSLK